MTLVATGADIKPLEVEMFMRDVESNPLHPDDGAWRTHHQRRRAAAGDDQCRQQGVLLSGGCGRCDRAYQADTADRNPQRKAARPERDCWREITFGYLPDEYLKLLANRRRSPATSQEPVAQI